MNRYLDVFSSIYQYLEINLAQTIYELKGDDFFKTKRSLFGNKSEYIGCIRSFPGGYKINITDKKFLSLVEGLCNNYNASTGYQYLFTFSLSMSMNCEDKK